MTRRPKPHRSRKNRPRSEGAFSISSLFSAESYEQSREERKAGRPEAWLASVEANPWGVGQDLPSLLQQVSLKSQRDSGGMFPDRTGSLSRRKVNLFSSLRLKKRKSQSEGKDQEVQKEIRTILTNLRNKG